MQRRSIQKSLQNKRVVAYTASLSILVAAVLLGVSVGSVSIPLKDVVSVFRVVLEKWLHIAPSTPIEPMVESIIMNIRLPRVVLAGLVGGALAISGAAFQGLLKNPLADPYTLGVSSGASLGAVLVIFLQLQFVVVGSFTLPLISIIFGFITILLVLFFSQIVQKSFSNETIILSGIIFSSFLSSLISLIIALTGQELRQIVLWLMGSVAMRGWEYTYLLLPFVVVGAIILLFNASELNALGFGEERARTLGVNVKRRKLWILSAASMLTGASVAVSGTIGFVGLVIPHMTRALFGHDHRHLLPLSIIIGAAFLILADLVARTIIAPTELPIGVVTAIIGAPTFAYILYRQRVSRRRKHD